MTKYPLLCGLLPHSKIRVRLCYGLLSLFAVGCCQLSAQSSPVVYTGSNAVENFLSATPDAEVTAIDQTGVTLHNKTTQKFTKLTAPGLVYKDASGKWAVTKPQVATLSSAAGWV